MDIIKTADGSDTLFSEQFHDIYHSRHGAIQESKHVFLKNGLEEVLHLHPQAESIRIFEAGFGTGLNALLTMLEAADKKIKMEYDTVELFPIPIETIKQLNYTEQLDFKHCFGPYHSMHLVRWEEWLPVTPYFRFRKSKTSLLEVSLPEDFYHLVYFDAFSPEQQPELWTATVFQKLWKAMASDGVLVTYCSKGTVQRAMKEAGFSLEKLAGPVGKREMLRAHKK